MINGWLSPRCEELLNKYAAMAPGNKAVELGSYCGKSAVPIGKAMKEKNGSLLAMDFFPKNSHYSCPDTGHKEIIKDTFVEFNKNMEENGLSDTVTAIRCQFQHILQNINAKYGFAYIDGSHTVEGLLREFMFAWRCTFKGSYIAFHDYYTDKYPDIGPLIDILVEKYKLEKVCRENVLLITLRTE